MSRRICVTNIGFRISEEEIRAYFQRFGPLSECKLQIDLASGSSRGFAFVTFATLESAQQCLSLTSHRIQEKSVSVFGEDQFSQSLSFKVPRSRKLFLSLAGLKNVSEASIYEVFQPFGEITSVEIVKSHSTQEPSYCLVYFRTHQSVDVCVARSHCINGRQVFVRRAVTREEVKLAEQRERELEAAKAQAKKVYGVHVPTQNVTVVQPRLFSSTPSLLSGPSQISILSSATQPRKRGYEAVAQTQSSAGYKYANTNVPLRPSKPPPPPSSGNGRLDGYGYI